MDKLHDYVHKYLLRALNAIKSRDINQFESKLSLEEIALIYHYTEDGYIGVNEKLRRSKGKQNTMFGSFLHETLRKLPSYTGLIYRNVDLSESEMQCYIDAEKDETDFIEYPFISTSKSITIANAYAVKCRFTIISKTGKDIEVYSKHGTEGSPNEKEVLFMPMCKFKILEVTKHKDHALIIMEEI